MCLDSTQSHSKVVVPQVEVHRVAWRRDLSPQLRGREADRVNVLTLLTLKMRVAVGKEIDTVISDDDASLAADVARQPRVARGIDVGARTRTR